MEEEEELEVPDLVELIEDNVEASPEQSQWLAQSYQPRVYFADTNQEEYEEAIILGLIRCATFPIKITGTTVML